MFDLFDFLAHPETNEIIKFPKKCREPIWRLVIVLLLIETGIDQKILILGYAVVDYERSHIVFSNTYTPIFYFS